MSPSGIPLFGQWDISKGVARADKNNPYDNSIIEIDSVSAAKKIYDIGKALFVDARSADSYAEGHVKGAISFPVGEPCQTILSPWIFGLESKSELSVTWIVVSVEI